MQREDVQKLLVYAATLWPRTFVMPKTEETLLITYQVWADVLSDLDPQTVRAAMADWEDEWPPTPRQLRNETLDLVRRQQHVPDTPDADEAFAEVIGAVRIHGYMDNPVWSHPAIGDTVRALGGWREGVCMSTNPEALRAHFFKMYEVAAARSDRRERAPIPLLAELDEPRGVLDAGSLEGVLKKADDL